jgi:hypothetical protein
MDEREIKSITDQAQIDSDLTALTATTDRHAPEEILALVGQKGDGWEITAITAGESTRWEPDGIIAPDAKLQWSMDRVSGKKVNPPAVRRTEQGYYARIMGNAVIVEAWLMERGYHRASAGSPHAVWIGSLCTGRMRLKAGNYHECDNCGYVPMEE